MLWVAASVVLAAAISPGLFGMGKEFAARYAEQGGLLGSLAGSCERAAFSRYFNRSLMFSALILFWPLWWRVRMLGRMLECKPSLKPPGIGWKVGLVHGTVGFIVAAGILGLLGIALLASGEFIPVDEAVPVEKFLRKVLLPALGASVAEEWLFRALLIGLWLRISRPIMACVGTSLVFSFVHFLKPPPGVELSDPRAWNAGFELLGLIMQNYLNPQFIAAELLTLFLVGMALGWARLRTGSLWLPIGMHAGWIFAFKSFNIWYESAEENNLGNLLVGESLRVGLLPLAMLALTWFLLAIAVRQLPRGGRIQNG